MQGSINIWNILWLSNVGGSEYMMSTSFLRPQSRQLHHFSVIFALEKMRSLTRERAMERSGREDQVRVEERLQPRRLAGVGVGEHSEKLPLLPHLLHPLQLSEPLLQEGDGGVEDCWVGAILPAHPR